MLPFFSLLCDMISFVRFSFSTRSKNSSLFFVVFFFKVSLASADCTTSQCPVPPPGCSGICLPSLAAVLAFEIIARGKWPRCWTRAGSCPAQTSPSGNCVWDEQHLKNNPAQMNMFNKSTGPVGNDRYRPQTPTHSC